MEPRSARHGRRKKRINPLITISILSLLVVAAFCGLLYWLMNRQEAETVTQAPASQAAPANNKTGADAGGQEPKEPRSSAVPSSPPAAPPEKPSEAVPESAGSSSQQPVPQTEPDRVKMAFVGDVMWASRVEALLKQNGLDYPYRELKSYLESADLTLANLETPVTAKGKPQKKDFIYRSSPDALPEFMKAGFDGVNLANNHILDYGQEGLLDTLEHLDRIGLKRTGAGKDIRDAYRPAVFEVKGMKIAMLGFSRVAEDKSWYATVNQPGVAQTYTANQALEAIKKAKEEADLVVVFAHWGVERQDKPVKEQTNLAHQYIDSGADLVVASHPHVLQGFEQYNGKWIAYSLGNFIFTTNEVPATWETVIMNASCAKSKQCDIELIPVSNKWAQPVRMSEEDGAKLFNRLSKISFNVQVDEKGRLVPRP